MQPRAIAIPIDDSPDSKFAVKFALKNVLREKDKVILLNVRRPVDTVIPIGIGDEYYEPDSSDLAIMLEFLADIEEKGIEQSHELLHRVASYLHTKGFKDVEEFSLQGDAREELLYKLEKIHPDLVIMGYQGKTIIQRALIGSVSGHLVRNLKIPIIVAKQPSE